MMQNKKYNILYNKYEIAFLTLFFRIVVAFYVLMYKLFL